MSQSPSLRRGNKKWEAYKIKKFKITNPKKYPGSITTASTDKINITSTNPYTTNITATN